MSFSSLLRDAPFGQLVRIVTRNKFFKYPEELPGFEIPWEKASAQEKEQEADAPYSPGQTLHGDDQVDSDKDLEKDDLANNFDPLTTLPTAHPTRTNNEATAQRTKTRSITREQSRPWTAERLEVEQQEAAERTQSIVIMPTMTADGVTLIDWYTTDDTDNPQNWPSSRKSLATLIIFLYTFAVYTASAIYTPSEPAIMEKWGIGQSKASLGLSMYVIGYGIGPLIFSPLSELPSIGRNPPYIITFILFVILAVPTALSNSLATLLVLRFLTGFMGSPALATGGASMGDMYSLLKLPYALSVWTAGAFCAPALGPLLSGWAVMNENWRWSLWEILWMSGPICILMFLFMPETSSGTILLRRAQRLRKLTGNPNLKSQSEIDQGTKKFTEIAWEQLVKPLEICVKDPAVLFTNIYTSYIYGVYYSFFEVFPLVYVGVYNFNLGELGLPFLTIVIGCVIGLIIYGCYNWFYLEPDIKKNGLRAQEHRLVPAILAVPLLPISIFWFGWTAHPNIHWICCTIGLILFPTGAFILFQCIFMYLPLTYPQYAASLFAANDFCRSALAAGSILYAHPLFINLGIGKGSSLLAGLLCGGVVGIWALYYFGAGLRARSKFAQK